MSELLIKPTFNGTNPVQQITPQSAKWSYVGFSVYDTAAGKGLENDGNEDEICVVLLSGTAGFTAADEDFGRVKSRNSVFDNVPPYAFYIPRRTRWSLLAHTNCEVAVCSAPGLTDHHPPRLISPDHMSVEQRGSGTNTRFVCNILPETEPADSLLVVEVITPSGNWSSYPPHKHDEDNLPNESLLEETYYHQINPPQGYVLHRVYDKKSQLDEVMAATHRSVVLVPRGYHPVGVPHGYESYYLNVMAGPKRVWKFYNDPDHEWIISNKGSV